MTVSRRLAVAGLAASLVLSAGQTFAQAPKEIRVDFAT